MNKSKFVGYDWKMKSRLLIFLGIFCVFGMFSNIVPNAFAAGDFAFNAYEQLNYRLATDTEFAQLLQTEVVGFGIDELNEGIFIVVDPMYANQENFDEYEEIFRVTT